MAETLRIGMIGCGEIAVQTAHGIANATHASHVMVMDTNEGVAADLGETYGVPHTTRVEDLLANPAVDAVYIAVPHHLHAPLTQQALHAGKQVLVEKPITTTLADADAMIAAARAAHLTLSIAYDAQVNPVDQRLTQLITAGTIGRVVGTRIVYRGDKPASYWHGGFTGRIATDWRTNKRTAGGGVLIMNTIHDLNTMRYLTGLEVARVFAEYDTYVTPVEVEDYISLTYRYTNGAIGSLEAGSALRGRDPLAGRNRVYGEHGQIILSEPPLIYMTEAAAGLSANTWHELATEHGADSRTRIIEGFAKAVLNHEPPPVTGEDGRAALEIALAAYRSGREHRPVTLPLAEVDEQP